MICMVARLLFLVAGVCALGGCYTYVPIEVTVRNANTKHPVQGATIEPDYARFMELFPPRLEPATTDPSGRATLLIAINYKSGRAHLFFPSHLLDVPEPRAVVDLPVEEFRQLHEAAKRSGQPLKPIAVPVDVLTYSEYRAKYPSNGHPPK